MHHTLLQSTKAIADVSAREVHGTEIRQLHVHGARCRPTAIVVGIHQSELVHPHLPRLHLVGDVTHTNHHHLHLAQSRVTLHTYRVVGFARIGLAINLIKATDTLCLGLVTGFLQFGKHIKIDIQHVLFGPHHTAIGRGILTIIATVGGELKGNLVLVVVILIVATHTHKHSQLAVLQLGGIGHQVVGMHKHLHVLVLAQVEVHVTINGLRLAMLQILHHHIERLLVVLNQLGL